MDEPPSARCGTVEVRRLIDEAPQRHYKRFENEQTPEESGRYVKMRPESDR